MAQDAAPLPVCPSTENVREVLGFLHYQLSQQAKEIAVLNRRVSELMQSAPDQRRVELSLYIDGTNKRLDGFAASIQSITDQLLHFQTVSQHNIDSLSSSVRGELSAKLEQVETHVNAVQHVADNSKCFGSVLEIKLADVQQHDARVDEALARLQTELDALKRGGAGTQKAPAALKKARPESHRRRLRAPPARREFEQQNIADIQPRPNQPRQFDRTVFDPEFRQIQLRIDECAKKSDLYELAQCFIASGAEGVADFAGRRRSALGRTAEAPRPIALGPPPRQIAAHVKIISGEALKRPQSNHIARIGRPPPGD
jgi:chromosome segregation ATPase